MRRVDYFSTATITSGSEPLQLGESHDRFLLEMFCTGVRPLKPRFAASGVAWLFREPLPTL
jgi:hypothetical protein